MVQIYCWFTHSPILSDVVKKNIQIQFCLMYFQTDSVGGDSPNVVRYALCPSVLLTPVTLTRMEKPTPATSTRSLLSTPLRPGQRSVSVFTLSISLHRCLLNEIKPQVHGCTAHRRCAPEGVIEDCLRLALKAPRGLKWRRFTPAHFEVWHLTDQWCGSQRSRSQGTNFLF